MTAKGTSSKPAEFATERPAWLVPALVFAAIAALSAAIMAYYFVPASDLLLSASKAEAPRIERMLEPRIGDNRFRIRERYVRAIVEDSAGNVATIDLHVAWPIQLADLPEHDPGRAGLLDPANAIYLTLAPASPEFDSTKRLQTIYPIYVDGPAVDAGNGLVRLAMKAGSGYDGQDIFVGGEGQRQFIARCLREDAEDIGATCTRDRVTDSGLAIRYRFNRNLLSDWQQLETGVAAFLDHIRAP